MVGGWAEARCWVLRNRAGSLRRDGLVFLGHYYINCWIFADLRVGVGVWLGPALTKLLVMVFQRVCCFPGEERSEGSGDSGLVFLPVF